MSRFLQVPTLSAVGLSLALGVAAWEWRTGAVGGSDSACYALMARTFANGAAQPISPLVLRAPWPDATRVAAPAGFLPSASRPGAAVPVCAPGYSWLVSPLVWLVGPRAVHLVPPLSAAALVWLAFVLARHLHSPWAGVSAALLVATSPIVLFQAVQPMNDITTGALWMAVAVAACCARPVMTGILVGLALLVRPNLALAAIVAVAAVGWTTASEAQVPSGWRLRAVRAGGLAALAAAPGIAVALGLNALLYGSAFTSGYGDLGALFGWANVPGNAARYGRTWVTTGTPLVLLALAAPFLVSPQRRTVAWASALIGVALCAVYLVYRPFDEWWYLRFLLPAVAIAATLAAVCANILAERAAPRHGAAMALVVCGAVAAHGLRRSETQEALGLRALEARFPLTAEVVAARVGAEAVPITLWQSGGLRFWPGNEVVVWDALDPAWLDRAIDWLTAEGRPPVIIVERSEEEAFRQRFGGQRYGGLDWPPRYDVDRRVRVFVPSDRADYEQGRSVPTETIRRTR